MGMTYFDHFCSHNNKVNCKQLLDEVCVTYCTSELELNILFLLLIGWEVASVSKGMYSVTQHNKGFPSVDVDVLKLVDPAPL